MCIPSCGKDLTATASILYTTKGIDQPTSSSEVLQEQAEQATGNKTRKIATTIDISQHFASGTENCRRSIDIDLVPGEPFCSDSSDNKQQSQTRNLSATTGAAAARSNTIGKDAEKTDQMSSQCSHQAGTTHPMSGRSERESEEQQDDRNSPTCELPSYDVLTNPNEQLLTRKKQACNSKSEDKRSRHEIVGSHRTPVLHGYRNEEEWIIRHDPEARTLLIADSNMRRAQNLSAGWDTHVFPCAHLSDVPQLLYSTMRPRTAELKTVFVQVGINDRNRLPPTCIVDDMIRATRVLHVDLVYVGVSASFELPPGVRRNIDEMNQLLKSRCQFIVSPLPSDCVRIVAGDRQHIHHDSSTVDAIVAAICDFEKKMIESCEKKSRAGVYGYTQVKTI